MLKIITFLLLFTSIHVNAQNLIPYPTFTVPITANCPPLYASFEAVEPWYEAGGTPDLYLKGCEYNYNGLFLGRNSDIFYINDGVLGLYAAFRTSYTIAGEVAAARLNANLIAGERYYFSVNVQPRGIYLPGSSPKACPIEPPLAVQVYASDQKITTVKDIEDGTALSVNADQVISLNSPVLSATQPSDDWTTLAGCFLAPSNYTDLAIGLSFGDFPPIYPCIDSNAIDNWFNFTYFLFDNFELRHIPSMIEDTFVLCDYHKEIKIDFYQYFDSIGFSYLNPVWSDAEGFSKRITTPGLHQFELKLNCGTILFNILVQSVQCNVNIFVPTAFSPNADGNNDLFHPFFYTDLSIENYKFVVFDKWGNLVYQTNVNDGFTGWDGTIKGKKAAQGVYVWSLTFDLIGGEFKKDKPYQQSGEIVLLY